MKSTQDVFGLFFFFEFFSKWINAAFLRISVALSIQNLLGLNHFKKILWVSQEVSALLQSNHRITTRLPEKPISTILSVS